MICSGRWNENKECEYSSLYRFPALRISDLALCRRGCINFGSFPSRRQSTGATDLGTGLLRVLASMTSDNVKRLFYPHQILQEQTQILQHPKPLQEKMPRQAKPSERSLQSHHPCADGAFTAAFTGTIHYLLHQAPQLQTSIPRKKANGLNGLSLKTRKVSLKSSWEV